jgi:hypothetical protein
LEEEEEMAMVRNGYGTKMIFTMVRNDYNSFPGTWVPEEVN